MVSYQRSSMPPFWELKSCRGEVHATRPHSHAEWSFGVVTGGSCEVVCAGKTVVVMAPSAVWFGPDTVHRCTPRDTADWAFQMLYWDAPGAEGTWGFRPLDQASLARWLGFFASVQSGRVHEFPPLSPPPGQVPPTTAPCSAGSPALVRPDRPYKRLHGLAPAQHRTVLRVRRAQALLRTGASPAEAALEAGFYDQSQFTRLFRALTGTTPGRYARF